MQKNRKFLISAALLVIVMILMAGTFAWTQTVNKVNEFIGTKTGDVILHDDFDGHKKHVYVENPNNVELFVRIKLNEAMKLGSNSWRPTTNSDWHTHTPGASCADCGNYNADNHKFHDYFTWTLGGQKWYMPGTSAVVTDNNVYNSSTPGARQTPNAQIITMAVYMQMTDQQGKDYIGWIYDTDGYAYWSQPLGYQEATGLLLNNVATSSSLYNTDYYYAIDVILETVDINDIPMWTQGAAASDGSGLHYQQATSQGIGAINFIVGLSAPAPVPPAPQPSPAPPVVPTTEEPANTDEAIDEPAADEEAPEEITEEPTDVDAEESIDEPADEEEPTP
ncbi:MAG: hypothetical protein FWF92_06390 [Oscillospiraceae bacterium]|nr:hypothetical protein [Oscillospiraceae bacterium]